MVGRAATIRCDCKRMSQYGMGAYGFAYGRIGDLAVLNRYIEVYAYQHTLSLQRQVSNGQLVGERHRIL